MVERKTRKRKATQKQKQKQQQRVTQTVNVRVAGGVMPSVPRPRTAPEFSEALAIAAMYRPPPVIQSYDPGLASSVQQNREAIEDLTREIARLGGMSIMAAAPPPPMSITPNFSQTGAPINISIPQAPPPPPSMIGGDKPPVVAGIGDPTIVQEQKKKLKKTPARVPAEPTKTAKTDLLDELMKKVPLVEGQTTQSEPTLNIMTPIEQSMGILTPPASAVKKEDDDDLDSAIASARVPLRVSSEPPRQRTPDVEDVMRSSDKPIEIFTYKGRDYEVMKGVKGGRFIMVDGKKIPVSARSRTRMGVVGDV